MAAAHERFGDLHWGIDDLAASVRRWIEHQTFAPRTGDSGVHLVDASAARYGRFEDVHLVGLVEGEWPERSRRNLFYSAFLLTRLGWPDDRVRVSGARSSFLDLLRLASRRVTVSTFLLEDDSLVDASALLGDVTAAGLQPEPTRRDATPIFAAEAVAAPPAPAGLLAPAAASARPEVRIGSTAWPPHIARGCTRSVRSSSTRSVRSSTSRVTSCGSRRTWRTPTA
jgi:inactivated superfamily I helicase